MADVMSRIVMSVAGTDEVANKIKKVRNEFEATDKAAQGIGANLGGASGPSPFDRATGGAGGGASPATKDPRQGMKEREHEHYTKHSGSYSAGGSGGAPLGRFGASAINAVGQAGSGNTVGGVASVLTSLGSFGKGGIAGVAAGLSLGAINSMSNENLESRTRLMTGLGQRLGKTKFDELQKDTLGMESSGFKSYIYPLLEAISQSGGGYNKDDIAGMMNLSYRSGADISSIGRLYGRLQSAGGGGRTAFVGGDIAQAGAAAFGQGRITDVYNAITQAVETAMTAGFQKGSAIFGEGAYKTFAQTLTDYGRLGKTSFEGGQAIFQGEMSQIYSAGAGVKTPNQAMQYMLFSKPGESYTDTLKRMSSPESAAQRFENLELQAGGDDEKLKLMVMDEYGYNIQQAEAFIRTKRSRRNINAQAAAVGAALGFGEDWSATITGDENLELWGSAAQRANVLKGVNKAAAKGLKSVTDVFSGGVLSPEAKAIQEVLKRRELEGANTMFSAGRSALGAGYRTGDYSNTGPIGNFITDAMSNSLAGNYRLSTAQNPVLMSMIPELQSYIEYKKNPSKASKNDADYFTKYNSAFETSISAFGGEIGARIAEPKQMDAFIKELQATNDANMDGNKGIYSIVEILQALQNYMENYVATPTGGTK